MGATVKARSRHPDGVHQCEAPTCAELIPLSFAWCPKHYAMISDKTQIALWWAARKGDHGAALIAVRKAIAEIALSTTKKR